MDIFIARQPIFDRSLQVYGYELLYRTSLDNFFTGLDDNRATGELLYNSFLVMGLQDLTEGKKAFINFSKDLITSGVPGLLPPDEVVIEVLEREKATVQTLISCLQLKDEGYTIALDDFILDDSNLPLIAVADIIKVEYPAVSHENQMMMIQKYGSKIKFLAEKIETREDYYKAVQMGYDYFQGYFFSKPALIASKEIHSIPTNIYLIMKELFQPEPSFRNMSRIIASDLGLSYKILKLANSVHYGSRSEINNLTQALSFIGIDELKKWSSIMLLKNIKSVENAELIKVSIIRGKIMELIAQTLHLQEDFSWFYFTGMFSYIDVLMNQKMSQIMDGLPLPEEVKSALRGENNIFRKMLECVSGYDMNEDGGLERCDAILRELGGQQFMQLYQEAIHWSYNLQY